MIMRLKEYYAKAKKWLSKHKQHKESNKVQNKKTPLLQKIKNRTIKSKTFLKIVSMARFCKNLILNTPIDFVFVFFASFILTYSYEVWERLLFSIGLSYIAYKIKDLIIVYITTVYGRRSNK